MAGCNYEGGTEERHRFRLLGQFPAATATAVKCLWCFYGSCPRRRMEKGFCRKGKGFLPEN